MIYRIPPLPFPAMDQDRMINAPASVGGQGGDFLDVLARTMSDIEGVQAARPALIDPTALPPYLMTDPVQKGPSAEESPMKQVIRFVLKQEGSAYVARDGGGKESSKYGILRATARGYGYEGNIRHLTRDDAEAIYEKMWKESGADKLPRSLAIVHFDTYINSPAAARKMLKASEGDVETYLDLRAQRYARLASRRPEKYGKYAKGWMNRVDHLRSLVAQSDSSPSGDAAT
jgi:lysozyme family protein